MKTAAFIAVLLASASSLADHSSDREHELAMRRAMRSSAAAKKHEARMKRLARTSMDARRDLDRIARREVNLNMTYTGPRCQTSRMQHVAAQRAYYRQVPTPGPIILKDRSQSLHRQ